MNNKSHQIICIGGLGGSGTRLVAQILAKLGVYLGSSLNEKSDNLLFTWLFKNPQWYINASLSDFRYRFRIFQKIMSGQKLNVSEAFTYWKAISDNALQPSSFTDRFKQLINNQFSSTGMERTRWAWKEPNTEIFVELIFPIVKNFKYIHVIRHGLDMAFSENYSQLLNWGFLYGINVKDKDDLENRAVNQLEFWIRVNQHVIKSCYRKPVNQFLLVNFDNLINFPEKEINRILGFMEIEPNNDLRIKLMEIVRRPATTGRYKNHNLKIFDQGQLEKVKSFGFEF